MNTTSENDRKLSEALKSLPLERMVLDVTPRKHSWLGSLGASVALAVACFVGFALASYFPNKAERLMAALSLGTWHIAAEDIPARNDEKAAEPVKILSTPVAPARKEVAGSGYVAAPDFTSVFSKYEGLIVKIDVNIGDHVAAGQVLVRLDDAGARFALDEAKIARKTAELELAAKEIDAEKLQTSLKRNRSLAATSAVSKQQLEDAETAFKTAVNNVAQAKQALAKAELDASRTQEQVDELSVRAPIAGTITTLRARVGDRVLARVDSVRENESLLTITNLDTMVIDADVAETNIALMRPGLEGEAVLDGFPDHPFKIAIAQIAPIVSSEKGTVSLRLRLLSPPVGMRPNMAARIKITTTSSP